MLIMVVLVARLPWLERAAGQDQLVRWHRRVSPWALGLIAAHVALITLGYAQAAQSGTLREVWVLVTSYPDMLAAFVGFGLLALAGITSVRLVKRRMRYETSTGRTVRRPVRSANRPSAAASGIALIRCQGRTRSGSPAAHSK
jgi:predicted ferric reductase